MRHLLIQAVCRQWFPVEETPLCRPTLLHLHLVNLFPHPTVTLRQWRIPFHLRLVEEWTPCQAILWLLCLLALTLPAPCPLKQILLPRPLAELSLEEEMSQCRLTLLHLHPVVLRLCLFPEVSHLYQPTLSGLE